MKILEKRMDCIDLIACALWTVKYRNFSSIFSSIVMENLYYNSEYFDEMKDYPYCV
jgi:hypothetical protein